MLINLWLITGGSEDYQKILLMQATQPQADGPEKRRFMKPYGRKTKKQVYTILGGDLRTEALERLEQIPDAQLVGHLFSHFYHMNDLIKFRSITAMGELASRVSGKSMEKARIDRKSVV